MAYIIVPGSGEAYGPGQVGDLMNDICEAVREVDKTTDKIVLTTLPERILALKWPEGTRLKFRFVKKDTVEDLREPIMVIAPADMSFVLPLPEIEKYIPFEDIDSIADIVGAEDREIITYFILEGSEGLVYELSSDGTYASLVGIGDCTDIDVYVAKKYEGVEVTQIGGYAFYGQNSNTYRYKTFTLQDTLKTIGELAFAYNTCIKTITMPAVEKISKAAFQQCSSLEELHVPATCTQMGEYVFQKNTALHKLTFGYFNYPACGWLIDGCTNLKILTSDASKDNAVVLPETCETIYNYTFANSKLETVELPASVKELKDFAFQSCKSLTSVSMPGMQKLGNSIYQECTALTTATIPATLQQSGGYIFNKCTSLNRLVCEKFDFTGGDGFLQGCTNIQNLTTDTTAEKACIVPADVAEIPGYRFYDCKLVTVDLPNTCKKIGDYAFYSNKNLTSVVLRHPTQISQSAFNQCSNLSDITIYCAQGAEPANAPWGASNASVNYIYE